MFNIYSILEVLIVIVPTLLAVAYITIAERKTMASMQRRLGPNVVGYYGLLQAFADALKLIIKEYVSPNQANKVLFFLGPIVTLIFSLLSYGVIPYGPGITIFDFNLGILYILAVASIATYGILLAGWSANSKYSFLGSLRSTAQLISYELILGSIIIIVIFFTGSLNLTVLVESQKSIWYIYPLLPVFIIFLICALAETNRAPMDLAEAESELVSGFMTEHAAVIFVFFFLAEYASIILMSTLTNLLFIGGYLYINTYEYLDSSYFFILIQGIIYGLTIGYKMSFIAFLFIWIRASFPRIRYDQLMSFCWTILLPIVVAFIIYVPSLLVCFDTLPINTYLL
jgi:NADH-ubiquinone oxidoreductase chain 1